MLNRTNFFILLLGLIVITAAYNILVSGNSLPTPIATGPTASVLVFRGETLHDLARLLRPMSFKVQSGSTTLNLRDAVYVGVSNGKARLLTVWVTQTVNDDSPLIPASDVTKTADEVATGLAQNALKNITFAVFPVDVSWENWTLKVSRAGSPVVKGTPATANQLKTAISAAPSLIAQVDTRSIDVPVGVGKTKLTAWQPWFSADNVAIQITPVPANNPAGSAPDISSLESNSGFIIGDEFINHIMMNEFKDRKFGGKTQGESFNFDGIKVSAQGEKQDGSGNVVENGKLVVSGNYVERPANTDVRIRFELTGPDLKPSQISAEKIECPASCAALRLKINGGILTINNELKKQDNPKVTPIRPEGVKTLGNFFIGGKAINGTGKITQIKPVNGNVVLAGEFRLFGGHLL